MSWSSSTGWNGRGWSRVAAAAGGTPATFIAHGIDGTSYHSATATTMSFPTGTQSGDLAFVWIVSPNATDGAPGPGPTPVTSPGNGGAAWTMLAFTNMGANSAAVLYARVLNSGDVGATPGFAIGTTGTTAISAGETTGVVVYRGPTHWNLLSTQGSDSVTGLTFTGAAPAGNSAGVVLLYIDWTDANPSGNVASDGTHSFTTRMQNHPWTQQMIEFDLLTAYAGGNVTTSGAGTNSTKGGWLVDLLP